MRYIFALATIALLSGCSSTAPISLEFDNSRTYERSRDDVWQSLVTYFESASIPVKTKNKETGTLLAVRKLLKASIYADCGSSDISSVSDGVLTVRISLQSLEAQKTRATVDVTFSAFRTYVGLAKSRLECFSNGTLEQDILKNLQG